MYEGDTVSILLVFAPHIWQPGQTENKLNTTGSEARGRNAVVVALGTWINDHRENRFNKEEENVRV